MQVDNRIAAAVLATLATLGVTQAVRATTQTWTGAGLDLVWETAANWSGAALPGASDIAQFGPLNLAAGTTVEVNSPQTITGLSINAANVTLGGSGSVSAASIKDMGGGTHNINIPLSVSTGSFEIAGTTLNLNSSVASTSGLTKTGEGNMALTGSTLGVEGPVTFTGGTLRLAGGAMLDASHIYLNHATLQVDNNSAGNIPDRITNGGTIYMRSSTIRGTGGYEKFGNVQALSGNNYLAGNGAMVIESLTRSTGAVVNFGDNIQGGNTVAIVQPPAMTNGLITGGAGFWFYNGGRVRTISQAIGEGLIPALVTDLNGGVATDNFNVGVTDAAPTATLSSSRTINSLQFGGQDSGAVSVLDLGANTLTLASGYFGGTQDWMKVTNGTLIPTGNELFVKGPDNGNRTITFDGVLADNGSPVNVVLFGGNNIAFSGTNNLSGNLYINGTNVSFVTDPTHTTSDSIVPNVSEIHFNGGSLNAGTGLTKPIIFDNGAISMNSGTFTVPNQLRGTGFISKSGDGDVTISAGNPNLDATFDVNRGSLSVTAAGALGTSRVLVNYTGNGGTLYYGTNGAAPSGVEVFANGTVWIGNNDLLDPLTTTDNSFIIHGYGQIAGYDGPLSQLTYGAANFVLEENALVLARSGLPGIVGLPNEAKWYFSGVVPAFMEVGVGTPWKGLSSVSLIVPIVAKGDFYLTGIQGSNGVDVQFNTNADILTETTPFVAYVSSIASGRGAVLNNPSPNYSGVSKFVVTDFGELEGNVANAFGGALGTAIPPVEVQAGGVLNLNVADALNANTTIKSGGFAMVDIAGGWTGTGVVTVESGGTVQTDNATALGGQLDPSTFASGSIIRISNGVNDVIGINNLPNAVIYEFMGHNINGGSHTQTASGDLVMNGGMITNHPYTSGLTLNNTAGGNVVIGAMGGSFSAATGSTFGINESIVSTTGADITVGGTVRGVAKNGMVQFNSTNNITGGTIHVTNGASIYVNGGIDRIGSAALSLEGGALWTNTDLATANVTASGNSGIVAVGGNRTLNNLTMASGASLLASSDGNSSNAPDIRRNGNPQWGEHLYHALGEPKHAKHRADRRHRHTRKEWPG